MNVCLSRLSHVGSINACCCENHPLWCSGSSKRIILSLFDNNTSERVLSSYFDLAEYFNPQERTQQRVYLTLGLKDSAPSTLLARVGSGLVETFGGGNEKKLVFAVFVGTLVLEPV